jgi:hypothetical protein
MTDKRTGHASKLKTRAAVDASSVTVQFSKEARAVLQDTLRKYPKGKLQLSENMQLMLQGAAVSVNVAMLEMIGLGNDLARQENNLLECQMQNLLGGSTVLADGSQAPPISLWVIPRSAEKHPG